MSAIFSFSLIERLDPVSDLYKAEDGSYCVRVYDDVSCENNRYLNSFMSFLSL